MCSGPIQKKAGSVLGELPMKANKASYLTRFGGIDCPLRYLTPELYC
jgi:hypothetical protein